jgi:hypothetical protein
MNTALFLSDATLQAIGWKLVHSLWQAAFIGLVLSLERVQTILLQSP